MAKRGGNLLGAWAFLAGVIIAVVVGFLNYDTTQGYLPIVLVVIGLLVGLLNVGGKEMTTFLLAAVSLVIVSFFGVSAMASVLYVSNILDALLVLFVPATVVVALRALFAVTKA